MDPEEAREIAERDQFWASLRALRPAIEQLATGAFEPNERERQLISLLARIVAAEMEYRARKLDPE